jgi:hypothetical protein
MPRERFSPEQIISKLREAEVLPAQGTTTAEVCRAVNLSEQTYYGCLGRRVRWDGDRTGSLPLISPVIDGGSGFNGYCRA